MDVTSNLIKYILFTCNFFFMVSGLLLTIFGCTTIFSDDPTNKFLNQHELVVVGIILLLLGISIFCVTFFGCWGAFYENYSMLYIYGIALSLLLVLQLIFYGIALYLSSGNSKEAVIHEKMTKMFKNYAFNKNNSSIYVAAHLAVDAVQSQYLCCGINGPTDWQHWNRTAYNGIVPISCCYNKGTSNACVLSKAFKEGCFHHVMDLISSKFKLSYIVISLIIQIFVIGSTFFLAKEISTRRSDYDGV